MRKLFSIGFALGCALLVAQVRAADAFDNHVANIRLLQAKEVQKELGVTEALRKRLNVSAAAHTKRLKAYEAELLKSKKDLRAIRPNDPRLVASTEMLNREVKGLLSAAQLKRLRELTLQQTGVQSLLDPQVAKRLGFSEAQKKKLGTTFATGAKKAVTLQQETIRRALGPYESQKPKTQVEAEKLRKEAGDAYSFAMKGIQSQLQIIGTSTESAMYAAMTGAQRSAWAALKGRKFTGK